MERGPSRGDMSQIRLRPNSWDHGIWMAVARDNEYHISANFRSEDVIIDVGAHIGAFTYLMLDRGAGKVFSVEPSPHNFQILQHNIHRACRATDRAILISAAVWHSGRPGKERLYLSPTAENTGGGDTLSEDKGTPVAHISIDSLISLARGSSDTGRVRLLKLDCEGAEWRILFHGNSLGFVEAVVGEYHEMPSAEDYPAPCTRETLERLLTVHGFTVETWPTSKNLGIFHAWKHGSEI